MYPKPALNALPLKSRPGVLAPDNRGKLILLGKSRYHFSGTSRVFVDQNYHASVKTLGTQAPPSQRVWTCR